MTDETKAQSWPIDNFTDEDLDVIDNTISQGLAIDPAVISKLVKEVREQRNQIAELTDDRNAMKKLEEIALEHWKTELKTDAETEPKTKGFTFIRWVLVEFSRGHGQFRILQNVMDEQEKKIRSAYHHSPADRLRHIFNQLEWRATKSQTAFKTLRDDMLVWARAIGLAANMAANGGTHREIDARMRGLIEMIESAVNAIRNAEEPSRFGYNVPDVFRSDYPVKEHVRRIHELERELEYERKRNDKSPEVEESADLDSVF
jgi:hypothetical protein